MELSLTPCTTVLPTLPAGRLLPVLPAVLALEFAVGLVLAVLR